MTQPTHADLIRELTEPDRLTDQGRSLVAEYVGVLQEFPPPLARGDRTVAAQIIQGLLAELLSDVGSYLTETGNAAACEWLASAGAWLAADDLIAEAEQLLTEGEES